MPNRRHLQRRRSPHQTATKQDLGPSAEHDGELFRDEYLNQQIEAALLSVSRHLSAKDTDLVRAVLHSSIEDDPVSRQLVANAIASHTQGRERSKPTKRSRG